MTGEWKKSSASSVGSYTTTAIPFALIRFMIPCTAEALKLSEFVFIVNR